MGSELIGNQKKLKKKEPRPKTATFQTGQMEKEKNGGNSDGNGGRTQHGTLGRLKRMKGA